MSKDVDIDTIEKKVIRVLADRLDFDAQKIKPESKLTDDLGMDSFGAVEVMYEIQDKFGIEIPDEDMNNIRTVIDIITYLKDKLS